MFFPLILEYKLIEEVFLFPFGLVIIKCKFIKEACNLTINEDNFSEILC